MKTRSIILALCFAMLFLFTAESMAQVNTPTEKFDGSSLMLTMSSPVDSLSTVNGEWINISKFDGDNFYTYSPSYGKLLTSAKGTPKVTVTIEGSFDQTNVSVIDTVGGPSDSLETFAASKTDLNNRKFPYIRFKFKGEARNRRDTIVKTVLYFYKKEY